MVNETNIISKLTKGLKFKIIKKKKNNWKTLNSKDSLPTTPEDEYMLYSDTEYELNHAKANIEANRSFSIHNENHHDDSHLYFNTRNTSNTVSPYATIGRSKTYNMNSSVTGPQPHIKNLYTQYSKTDTTCKNQTASKVHPLLQNKHSSFIINKHLPSSNPITTFASAPSSPVALDTYDTCFSEMKVNLTNPFLNMKPKDNSTTTTKKDPALEAALISPIEFDSNGNKIDSPWKTSSTPATPTVPFAPTRSTPLKETISTSSDPLFRNKSVKRIKPLITFDTPPVVSPITAETDSEEYAARGRKRNSKKHKKYSKKRSSPLTVKTNDVEEDTTKDKVYSEPTSAIVARANSRLNSPNGYDFNNEEDDDVPLGIIQYKCISSILKDVGPTTISSLQSNHSKKSSSHKSKSTYGYMTPPHDTLDEKYDFQKLNKYASYYQESYVI